MQRDSQNDELLSDKGWYVIHIWEMQVKNNFEDCINRIVNYIQNSDIKM